MTEIISIRYRGCIPHIKKEGYFKKPIPVIKKCKKSGNWYKGLSPWERLASHHTMSSARKFSGFICTKAPKDELDFLLESTYNPTEEPFADKMDIYLQPETQNISTWRNFRNTIQLIPQESDPLEHPLFLGGITEKRDLNNMKLMNSGIHSAQSNPGYIRNGQGGNMFYY